MNISGTLRRLMTAQHRSVIQGFWHGPQLGPLRSACIASFVERGHRFELYTYDKVSVPAGVILMNAAEIIPLHEVFYFANPKTGRNDLGPFSDLFRFKLLFERGGWWSDVDTICLSHNLPPIQRAWAQEKPEYDPDAIGTSQIAFPKGDSIVGELYQRCLSLSKTAFREREALGPHLLSNTVRDLNLPKNSVGSPSSFYPVRWIEMFKLWLPQYREEIEERASSAFFLPIFQSFPQYIGLDLDRAPPMGSYLGEFCRRYGCFGQGKSHDAQEILDGTRRFLNSNAWAPKELAIVCGDQASRELGFDC
jgi:hypothetical protein